MDGSGSLEEQFEALCHKANEIRARRGDLKKIEELGAILEEHLILDNRYTEHSTVGLAQQWDQLDQLAMRMQHNLKQQIQARNQSGVSEDSLKEFSMMFKHFDKDKSGKLNHQEFKSCLRALGYDLPMVDEGQPDPEFDEILSLVDPNRDGYVSLQEYIAFMISKETENVQSYEEIENAFRAITASSDRPYVTKDELYSVSYLTPIFKNGINQFIFINFSEPHQGNGRLLRAAYETIHRSEDGSQCNRRIRLR
jgi:spectrin alpha